MFAYAAVTLQRQPVGDSVTETSFVIEDQGLLNVLLLWSIGRIN